MTRRLVLVGGGHTHVHVLLSLGREPVPDLAVTLVSRDLAAPYSGMLPGHIAGHYTHAQCHIDLEALTRFAGARLIHDEAVGLDRTRRCVISRSTPPVDYDFVSIDIGSTPDLRTVPGAAEHAIPIKPIDGLARRWQEMLARIRDASGSLRVLTVGGGAAGVEITLAMQHRLRGLQRELGRDPGAITFTIVTGAALLSGHNESVQNRFRRVLEQREIAVIEHSPVQQVEAGAALCGGDRRLPFDELVWATDAGAAPWLADTGLALNESGFLAIDDTLRVRGEERVFAVGDVATSIAHPRPKAGVFAVRQGPPLVANLRRALAGKPLEPFVPQRAFLSLISTGDRYVIASRGSWAAQGALLWYWKDWIDRRWIRQYQVLPVSGSKVQ